MTTEEEEKQTNKQWVLLYKTEFHDFLDPLDFAEIQLGFQSQMVIIFLKTQCIFLK